MRIICSTCASHYEIEAEKIPAAGQLVRCSQCRDVWLVRRPEPAEAAIAIEAPLGRMAARPSRSGKPGGSEPISNARHDADSPIDFAAARARLRPRRHAGATSFDLRGTLGALALGLFCMSAVLATIASRPALIRHVSLMASLFDSPSRAHAPQNPSRGETLGTRVPSEPS